MKKFITAAIAVTLILNMAVPSFTISADSAGSAILIHADSGEVLYEKNASARVLIASTTKMMSALVALENSDPNDRVVITRDSVGIEGSSMYLAEGQEYSLKELLYGMMLASGNDAAVAVAYHVAGGVPQFAELMNEKAQELGLKNTHFTNPHGLDAEEHYGSAADLATIAAAAMENEIFKEIVSTKSITIGELTFVNHNKLLWEYEGCIGIKTGYTIAAGRSLVSCVEREGLRLICVTISDPDDWNTHKKLYNWGFESYSLEQVRLPMQELSIPLVSGLSESVAVACNSELFVLAKQGDKYKYRIELPPFVYAPVKAGDVLGRLTVSNNGIVLGKVNLCAAVDSPRDEQIRLTAWERFKLSWYRTNRLGLYYPGF